MDQVTRLVTRARAAGFQLAADGDRLVVQGPRHLAPLAEALLAAKDGVLGLLRHEAAALVTPYVARLRAAYDDLDDGDHDRLHAEARAGDWGVPLARLVLELVTGASPAMGGES